MSKKDLFILFVVSLLNVITIFIISHHLKLIDINLITNDKFITLIYSIVYLVVTNLLILLIYYLRFKDKGSFRVYFIVGLSDFIIFFILLYFFTDVDLLKVWNELLFTFLIIICNSFFICYSIYYKNLLKYNSSSRMED